jgi:hypothetical protein
MGRKKKQAKSEMIQKKIGTMPREKKRFWK